MTISEYNAGVDSYADGVYRFILKNIKDAETARDITQDTFEKAWLKKDSIEATKFKSYLFTAAYHTLIDHVRKSKKISHIPDYKPDMGSDLTQYSDLHEILHEAVDKLPEAQRMVVMLRDYEGYSYQEIEEITGLNESQVKVYIYRARLFLKSYIGKLETVI